MARRFEGRMAAIDRAFRRFGRAARNSGSSLVVASVASHVSLAVITLALAVAALLQAVPDRGMLDELAERAELALGQNYDVSLGSARWSVKSGAIALEIGDLSVTPIVADAPSLDVREARVALAPSSWTLRKWSPHTLSLRGIRATSGEGLRGEFSFEPIEVALRRGVPQALRAMRAAGVRTIELADARLEPPQKLGKAGRLKRRWFSIDNLRMIKAATGYVADGTIVLAEGTTAIRATFADDAAAEQPIVVAKLEPVALERLWNETAFLTRAPLAAKLLVPRDLALPITLSANLGGAPLGLGKHTVGLDGASIELSLLRGEATVDALTVEAGGNRIVGTGRLLANGDAKTGPLIGFELSTTELVLAPGDLGTPTLHASIALTGEASVRTRAIDISAFDLTSDKGSASGSARVVIKGRSPALHLSVRGSDLDATAVASLWPSWIAADARRWLAENVGAGRVETGSLELHLPEGHLSYLPDPLRLTPEMLTVAGEFSGAAARIIEGFPTLRSASGNARFEGASLNVDLLGGTIKVPQSPFVRVAEASFSIPDVTGPKMDSRFDVRVDGAAHALATLANSRPFRALEQSGIEPDGMKGRATGTIAGRVALRDVEERDWKVTLALSDVSLGAPIEGRSVADVTGSLVIDPQRAVLDAIGSLDGVKAKFDLSEPLAATGLTGKRERSLTATLDSAAIDRLAPGLGDLIGGTTKARATQEGERTKVEADLENATISLPWMGWSKRKGVPAQASFSIVQRDGTVLVEDLRVSGNAFGGTGKASVDGKGLASAEFRNVSLSPDDSFSVSIRRDGELLRIAIDGERFDARSLLATLDPRDGAPDAGGGADVAVEAKLEEIRGHGGLRLRGVNAVYRSAEGTLSKLSVRGRFSDGKLLAVDVAPSGAQQDLFVTTDALGRTLRLAGLYERMRGGILTASATRRGDGPWSGFVDASSIRIDDEPKLRNFATRVRRARKLDTRRISFSRAFGKFEFYEGRLALTDAVMRGPEIGATFQGVLFDAAGRISMTGTFLPAYGVNRVFGEVPVLGALLGNGRDKGLLGLTFRVTGSAERPNVEVNPLSLVAPGIFRSIFEYGPGREG